ncbi:MAG TPA: site-specific DNA-methyltransferase [Thermoplasmata archaeon]|nr:site-specific DNA-methyltransferase [Thermoplasmata archaeon]
MAKRPIPEPQIRVFNEDCIQGMQSRLDDSSVSVIVTSPPYNIGKAYRTYRDSQDPKAYLDWIARVAEICSRVLEPDGSFFLNLGGKPSDPWWPIEVGSRVRESGFTLQNTILWVKSIAISKEEVGDYPGIAGDIAVGHYQPVNSRRYVNGLSEYVFHFTKGGNVELDKLGVGVPYQDKSNVTRWKAGAPDLRDRGNVWFIPYETVREGRAHPCVFPVKLPEMCIKLHGVSKTKLVVDPFLGTGSTALACDRLGVDFVGFEIDPYYVGLAKDSLATQREVRAEYRAANAGSEEIPWDRVQRETE